MVTAAPAQYTAAKAGDLRSELGETPRLDARTGHVVWTDISQGKVHIGEVCGDGVEAVRTYDVGGMAGPVTPLQEPGAGWVMAREREVVHLAEDGTVAVLATPEEGRPTAFNDGVADPAGNLWAGSMGRNGVLGAGRLWRFDTAGRASVMLEGIGISNGIGFTDDGRAAYYADTATGTLERLDLGPGGTVTARRTIVTFQPGEGDPDGLALDDEGCIWVAMWDGWAVRRYSPEGELLAVVNVPVARPTAVCFAGRLLVVTTCSGWLPDGWELDQPAAGKLFAARVDVGGQAARPYRGPLGISTPGSGEGTS